MSNATRHEGGPGRPVEVDSKFSLPKGRALDCVRLGVPARKDRSPAPAAFEHPEEVPAAAAAADERAGTATAARARSEDPAHG